MHSLDLDKISIHLLSIKEGISLFHFKIEGIDQQADARYRFPGRIAIDVQVTKMGDDLLVDLKVKSRGTFKCDRCCESFQKDIEGELRVLFTFDDMKCERDPDGEIKWIPPGKNDIDITQDVLDALLLAVPVKILCRDNCKGLCLQCGTNLNKKGCHCQKTDMDPRWEALKNL